MFFHMIMQLFTILHNKWGGGGIFNNGDECELCPLQLHDWPEGLMYRVVEAICVGQIKQPQKDTTM